MKASVFSDNKQNCRWSIPLNAFTSSDGFAAIPCVMHVLKGVNIVPLVFCPEPKGPSTFHSLCHRFEGVMSLALLLLFAGTCACALRPNPGN